MFKKTALLYLFLASLFSPLAGREATLHISVMKSLIDPATVREWVERNYNLNEPVHVSLLSAGVNDIYLVVAENKKYIFRLSRADKSLNMTEEAFIFELEWLDFLHQQQVSVAYPLKQIDGHFCSSIKAPEGLRYATLFSYAEGKTDMDEKKAFILGEELARLHMVSDTFTTSLPRFHLDLDHLVLQPVQQIKNFLGKRGEEKYALLDALSQKLTQQITAMEKREGSYGIIAGDMHGENQHFDANNQITMFDFEFCAYCYRVYDLATFKWGKGAESTELWNSFLQGYQSVRHLSEAELQAIDTFVQARHLWWMGCLTTLAEHRHTLDDEFWEYAFSRLH